MRTPPAGMIRVLVPFAPLFSKRVWRHAQVLLMGAILAPGKRTVSSALRAVGLDQQKRFHRYHRVLSRAKWSTREASRVLLGLLVEAFVPDGPLILGVDETLERRQGKKIAAKGIYRGPARKKGEAVVRRAVWYDKEHPTFSDALALVRKELWSQEATFCGSSAETETVKVPREFIERLTEAVCYAA